MEPVGREGEAVGPVPADERARVSGRQEGRCEFTAPLGSAASGWLEFVSRACRVTIRAEASTGELYRASFTHPGSVVRVQGGTVVVDCPDLALSEWLHCWGDQQASVVLSGHTPWRIELRGGASQLTADLRGLSLSALEVNDGASRVDLTLPPPSDAVPIRILGGATNVAIHRPLGVPTRIHVRGGATNMVFDDQRFGVAPGELEWETPGDEEAAGRYDIEVTGGASQLTLDTWAPGAEAR